MAVYHFAWDLSFYLARRFRRHGKPALDRIRALDCRQLSGAGRRRSLSRAWRWRALAGLPAPRRGDRVLGARDQLSQAIRRSGRRDPVRHSALHRSVERDRACYFCARRLRSSSRRLLPASRRRRFWPHQPSTVSAGYGSALRSEVRPSNDYNPLLPWFGMVLRGIAIARIVPRDKWPRWQPHDIVTRMLALIGRHSLLFYLLHQPVLLGTLWAVAKAIG